LSQKTYAKKGDGEGRNIHGSVLWANGVASTYWGADLVELGIDSSKLLLRLGVRGGRPEIELLQINDYARGLIDQGTNQSNDDLERTKAKLKAR